MSSSIPGQYTVDLALSLHLKIPKCPVWRHLRHSFCSDFGITILVPFMMTPSTMLKFHLCNKNACRSGSILACWSGHPAWTTLANLTQSQVLTGFTFDLINLAFLKHADSSDGDIYGPIFQCRFSLYIMT